MRLVAQRVTQSHVISGDCTVASIQTGLLILVGIARTDTRADADYLLKKILDVRIFPDDVGKMNRTVREVGGAILFVSQFTLVADCRRGRRPDFSQAAPAEQALVLYEYLVAEARRSGVPVESGVFQTHMRVSLVNDGPVTLIIDSADTLKPK